MNDDNKDNEIGAKENTSSSQGIVPNSKSAFSNLGRQLIAEHLKEEGTQILTLNEIDRLNNQVEELSEYKNKFHQTDKEKAVLEKQLNSIKSFEIIYTTAIAFGSALLGYSRTLEDENAQFWIGIIGVFLIFISIIAKLFNLELSVKSKK